MKTYLTVIMLVVSALGADSVRNPLDDPRQEVRGAEAIRLRANFKPTPASKWNGLVGRLKTGITFEEVKKILGPTAQTLRPGFGYMNGTVYVHRLDDCWLLRFEIGRFDPGLTSTELVASLDAHHTNPPESYTGTWRDYFVSGIPCRETEYRHGKPHGHTRIYHDNGTLYQLQAYVDGVQHGEIVGYYPDKTLRFKGLFTHGKRSGTWISYNNKGDEISTEHIKPES
jgi:hypothetical protein